MTGFDAITKVYDELTGAGISVESENIFQFAKPPRVTPDEFIVLNTLPVADAILQQVFVNCNVYVRDIDVGVPDNFRLEQIGNEVLSLLPISREDEDIHVFLDYSDIIADPENERHYFNIRLEVIMLNN